jgi:hypothetical protein
VNEEKTTDIDKTDKVSINSRKHFKYRSNECLNCSQPLDLSDRFCPYCSQLNSTKPLTLADFIKEFFSSLVSYDSRLRFTVTDLLFRPGKISKNYISGKRLRYTNPFRFFLSVSIIYFLMYSVVNFFNPSYDVPLFDINKEIKNDDTTKQKNSNETAGLNISNTIKQDTIHKKNLATTALLDNTAKNDSNTKQESEPIPYLIVTGDTIKFDTKNKSYPERVATLDSLGTIQKTISKFDIFLDFYKDTEIKDSKKALDSLNLEQTRFNQWLYKKNKTLNNVRQSPGDFINYMLSKVPFFVFFFAPIYALFLWLLYVRRRFTYMEHLVFIFHIFSFVFLALIIGTIPDLIFGTDLFVNLILGLVGPVYFYLALRKFYGQSHIKTIIKFLILNFVFLISSITAALVFFAGTAALY